MADISDSPMDANKMFIYDQPIPPFGFLLGLTSYSIESIDFGNSGVKLKQRG